VISSCSSGLVSSTAFVGSKSSHCHGCYDHDFRSRTEDPHQSNAPGALNHLFSGEKNVGLVISKVQVLAELMAKWILGKEQTCPTLDR
jgi:hypothetical protein